MLFDEDKVIEVIKKNNVQISAYRLLFFLITISDENGKIKEYSRSEITDKLELTKAQLSRNFSSLEENEIIIRIGKGYRLHKNLLKIK